MLQFCNWKFQKHFRNLSIQCINVSSSLKLLMAFWLVDFFSTCFTDFPLIFLFIFFFSSWF